MARKLSLKPNVPKVNFESYFHIVRGNPKVGKTTLFRDLMEAEYGDYSAGLLLALGSEPGVTAISGIHSLPARDWDELREIVKELVSNRSEYPEVRVIGLDTIDELNDLAEREVIAEHRRRNYGKDPKNYQSALGGYKAPNQYKTQIIKNMLTSLRNAGYGVFAIGHTKEVSEDEKHDGQVTGEQYSRLVSNLSHKDAEVFTNMADVISTIYVERYVDAKKYGKESTTTSRRFIYFRDNNFVEAGSRFPEIVERIEWVGKNGAPAYLKAFRDGVLNSAKVDESSIKSLQDEEKSKMEKAANEYVGGEVKQEVKDLATRIYSREGMKDKVLEVIGKYTSTNKIDDVENKDIVALKTELEKLEEEIN